jgi:hypothetical protein
MEELCVRMGTVHVGNEAMMREESAGLTRFFMCNTPGALLRFPSYSGARLVPDASVGGSACPCEGRARSKCPMPFKIGKPRRIWKLGGIHSD